MAMAEERYVLTRRTGERGGYEPAGETYYWKLQPSWRHRY